ncbi:MAG TPA: glycerophosphodiester phosphodiesterase family protein, partial [Myxococcota bacterium]
MRRAGRDRPPLVIAHRGASAARPENTLSAFALALEQGADMIELDLHRTRDGALVVAHDESLERLGGTGEIGAATLVEIRALDAGEGEKVPTLDEVLDRFGGRIALNLELKRGVAADYPGLERAVLDAVEARGLLDQALFSSFSDPILRRLRARSRAARIGVLVSPRAPECWLERARVVDAESVHFWVGLVNEDVVGAAHAAGLGVLVY